jgi:hypothetical protein
LFYDAAVAEAEGLLKGWQDMQPALEAQMDIIARAMVKAIKKALKMQSPSRVFADIGEFSGEGLIVGAKNTTSAVEQAYADLGNASVDALAEVMKKANDVLAANTDMNPTITPVLDLTQMTKDANAIASLLTANPVVGQFTLAKASDISASQMATADATASSTSGPSVVEFNQYNNSPKALSASEIYLNTRSQLAMAKEAL